MTTASAILSIRARPRVGVAFACVLRCSMCKGTAESVKIMADGSALCQSCWQQAKVKA